MTGEDFRVLIDRTLAGPLDERRQILTVFDRVLVRDVETARAQGLINESEAAQLAALAKAVADVINVDDFAPEELTHHGGVSSTISPANAA